MSVIEICDLCNAEIKTPWSESDAVTKDRAVSEEVKKYRVTGAL